MSLKKYSKISDTKCLDINGYGGEWIGDVLSALGQSGRRITAIDAQRALDQLNGKRPRGNIRSCGPYGTGGTPNVC